MSYYTDIYTSTGELIDTQTSSPISDYASVLKDNIDAVLTKTGKSQVIIIAHSMGGLVSREYMRIYDDDSVYKLIMIGTPNQGIGSELSDLSIDFTERWPTNLSGTNLDTRVDTRVVRSTEAHDVLSQRLKANRCRRF